MESASEAIWNPAVAGVVLATALLLTLVTFAVQLRAVRAGIQAWRNAPTSALGAPLLLASSASMGTITAAALAVTVGGPGALIWMWIATALGLALPFGEAALTSRYFKKHGTVFVRAAAPLGAVLAVLFAVGSISLGLVGGGLFQGHEVGVVWSLTMGTSAAVGAALCLRLRWSDCVCPGGSPNRAGVLGSDGDRGLGGDNVERCVRGSVAASVRPR